MTHDTRLRDVYEQQQQERIKRFSCFHYSEKFTTTVETDLHQRCEIVFAIVQNRLAALPRLTGSTVKNVLKNAEPS